VLPAGVDEGVSVARILIVEPHTDIRALLELVVRRLGHEPHVWDGSNLEPLHADAAVIEPGEGVGLALARRLRRLGVPVLFTSIFPADHDALELQPAAYLVKPFPLYALETALTAALEPRAEHPAVAAG
jgi:DNA-binding response OmpR family regulator